MKNWRVWILTDCNGNVLIEGRKKDVCDLLYQRFTYSHIFTDCLYRTERLLND